ncbi:uncharacterized protein N7498_004438 [Penicillium cinerascens]|uniref:X8 domain-containing protein n=1 Tax=Penicillium cinerascens TaxID=70096 RepID=A0A9W9T7V1_9EURO|nr:uncharacterized protein N7498_004438 [Penicillium cinerascens]KAJ5212792.1 hypothetical protein N7498_004438 [Penicillium cinerascens]
MCGVKDELAFALNKYYTKQGKKASAYSFSGSASIKVFTKASPKTTGTCSTQLKEAGTAGTVTRWHRHCGLKLLLHVTFGSFQCAAFTALVGLSGLGMVLL